ncbi:MAG: sigma-70 family RNA polymerase sigma factor [Bacteroidota bacterium]
MFFRKKTNIKEMSDELLVSKYQETADGIYVGELFERYTHLVYLVCMKYLKNPMEAEDLSMQVFEKLLKDLGKYEVRKFKPWLHTVVKNQCLIHLDKAKRKRNKEDDVRENELGRMESDGDMHLPSEAEMRESDILQMEAAMKLLNDQQRTCLELFYLQEKSYQEVSDATGYTMKQVKSYIQNGKRNLKKHIEQSGTPVDGRKS